MQICFSKIHSFYLVLFVALITGCNPFAPALSDDVSNTSLILTEQATPQEVMTNFAFAYNFKDSLVYSDLIDTTFLFISKDYSTDPVTDLSWGRDIELKTTSGLFKKSQTLNLIWGGTVYENYSDSSKVKVEMKKLFQLTLDIDFVLRTINGESVFNMRKNSSGRWKITRWEDKAAF